jgi:5,10-methylenetetrahydrofolate reductase
VTYRGGRISRERTTRVVVDLLRTTDLTPMPHLTCVAHPRFELGEIAKLKLADCAITQFVFKVAE